MLKTRRFAFLAVVSMLCARPVFAADSSTHGPNETPTDASVAPSLGFTVLGGLWMPSCVGQEESCTRLFGPAPSIRALVLYQPTANWGLGLVGQVAWVHWTATYVPFFSGPNPQTQTVESDLTAGFGGIAARYTAVPDWRVTPVIEFALGASFQAQTGSNFGCNGPAPAGELGLGASARLALSLSAFAMASATGGFRGESCGVADGPPATPFAGWGYGLHAGVAFDVGVGSRSPGAGVARRWPSRGGGAGHGLH
jgi:hypothetical protein